MSKYAIHCKNGKTRQEMLKECDINQVMKRFKKTGNLPDMIKLNPNFGDFSNVGDYHTALNTVIKAENQFNNLSAEIRKRFNNNPAEFLEFTANPENIPEMEKLGLLRADYKPPVVNEAEKKEPLGDEKK